MGANDHRTRVTKLLIRKAFTGLLREKPIQSISVKELCQAAGINRGTFYAHYTDMYDLRDQIEQEMMDNFQMALKLMLEQEPGEVTPVRLTAGIFQCLKDNSDMCTVTLGQYGDKEFAARLITLGRERYVELYRRYFQNATARQLEYYYVFVSAGCIGLLEKWMSEGMAASAEEMAAMAESIMARGIGFLDEAK